MVSPISDIPAWPVTALQRFCRTRTIVSLAMVAWLLTTAGCAGLSPQREVLMQQPDGLLVERVTGLRAPDAPPVSAELTAANLEESLRRIMVEYHMTTSFVRTDPMPLLTQRQTETFAAILARELPAMRPNQRIRFSFKDARKGNPNEMDVYRDGPYLVYDFALFVANPKLAMNPNEPPFSEASVVELPSQKVWAAYPRAIYRDPVAGTAEAKAVQRADKLALVAAAHAEGVIGPEEADRLRQLVEQHPEIQLGTWRRYWDKRGTLSKAHDLGLVDDPAYRAQRERLERELVP